MSHFFTVFPLFASKSGEKYKIFGGKATKRTFQPATFVKGKIINNLTLAQYYFKDFKEVDYPESIEKTCFNNVFQLFLLI